MYLMLPDPHTDNRDHFQEATFFVECKGVEWTEAMCRSAAESYERHCAETDQTPTGRGYVYWAQGKEDAPIFRVLLRFIDVRQWTRNWCIHSLQAFNTECADQGISASQDRYIVWKRTHPEAPSKNTIKTYLGGTWASAHAHLPPIADGAPDGAG